MHVVNDSDVRRWVALDAAIGSPGGRSRAALPLAQQSLEMLDAYFQLKRQADHASTNGLSDEELDHFVQQVLSNLRNLREAASEDIRELISWAGSNTDIPTAALGKASGFSPTTVNRQRKAAIER